MPPAPLTIPFAGRYIFKQTKLWLDWSLVLLIATTVLITYSAVLLVSPADPAWASGGTELCGAQAGCYALCRARWSQQHSPCWSCVSLSMARDPLAECCALRGLRCGVQPSSDISLFFS